MVPYHHGNGLGLAKFVWFGEQSFGYDTHFTWHADFVSLLLFFLFLKIEIANQISKLDPWLLSYLSDFFR
jgi:hypothetical protein